MPDPHALDWETAFDRAYGAAYAVLRDAAHAEEVAQEACVKALVKLDSFKGIGSFPGWVRRIAYRLALDARRGLRPAGPDPDALEGDDDPEAGAFSREVCDALHRCLGELTDHQQLIFLGKYLDGMKGREVALEANVSEGTVWPTLNQSAEKLRKCLDRRGIDRGVLR